MSAVSGATDALSVLRCVKCRNPICSLCAEETSEGLMCSPACGVPDPVGERDRRSFKLLNLAVILVLLFASVESVLLFHSIRDARSKDGKVVVETTNRVARDGDVTRHAEIVAVGMAQKALGTKDLSG